MPWLHLATMSLRAVPVRPARGVDVLSVVPFFRGYGLGVARSHGGEGDTNRGAAQGSNECYGGSRELFESWFFYAKTHRCIN